jgi:hypothetical protein
MILRLPRPGALGPQPSYITSETWPRSRELRGNDGQRAGDFHSGRDLASGCGPGPRWLVRVLPVLELGQQRVESRLLRAFACEHVGQRFGQ